MTRQQSAFGWDEFENYISKQFAVIDEQPWTKGLDPTQGIENYVQNVMKRVFRQSMSEHSRFNPFESGIDYRLQETPRQIIVHCPVPDETAPDAVRFYVSKRKLKIEHSGKSEEIVLPSDVDPSRSTAKLADGRLEVHMPKLQDIHPFQEIPIRS